MHENKRGESEKNTSKVLVRCDSHDHNNYYLWTKSEEKAN